MHYPKRFDYFFMRLLLLILPLFFQINVAMASPLEPCNPSTLKTELIMMGLDPDIKNNKELLSSFEIIYGREVRKYLSEMHRSLIHNEDQSISAETVNWAIDAIWKSGPSIARYYAMLFDISNFDIRDYYYTDLFSALSDPSIKTKLLFIDQEDFEIFKDEATTENLAEALEKVIPDLSDSDAKAYIERFNEYYLDNEHGYTVGFEKIKEEKPVIVITGHGDAKDSTIEIKGYKFEAKQIALDLKEAGIPLNSSLVIESCFSGCSVNKINYSINQIKSAFLSGTLAELHGSSKNSFIYHLMKEINTTNPLFNGKVSGYLGIVKQQAEKNVLRINGTKMEKGFATEILNMNNETLLIKREDALVSISKKDVM